MADLDRDLVPGVWDIPEPDPGALPRVELAEVDFALVPALAVDRDGYRLGYGAGYFDGLLAARRRGPICVTALPAAFVVDALPHEPHDIAVDLVVANAARWAGRGAAERDASSTARRSPQRYRARIRAARGAPEGRRGIMPGLAVVIVGDDPASQVYVRNKALASEAIGMHSEVHALSGRRPRRSSSSRSSTR